MINIEKKINVSLELTVFLETQLEDGESLGRS